MKDMDLKITINKKVIVAFFGKSGSGKDSIVRYLSQLYPESNKIIPFTTRPRRSYEVEGKDYFFTTEANFCKMVKEKKMVGISLFNKNWHYGANIDTIANDKINYGIFNIAAIEQMKSDARLLIIPVEVVADDKRRLMRALEREEKPDCYEICRRYLSDYSDYQEIPFSYLIIENNIENNLPKAALKELWTTVNNLQTLDFII